MFLAWSHSSEPGPDRRRERVDGPALDTPSLSRYWPYFESKRRREILQNRADSLEMKLLQDEVNLNQEEARSTLRE
jgi:hypothetical protein